MAMEIYDWAMLFWRFVVHIFFREIRPRGTFNIPQTGPVIFVGGPHNNQFLDPLLLSLQVYGQTSRHVRFLAAAKSMKDKVVGPFIRLLDSIPVVRAADGAKPGTGRVTLSEEDPCIVLGIGTRFLSELTPRMQIMLPKNVNSAVAEVIEIVSDTCVKVKRDFNGDKGKATARVRERIAELKEEGVEGLEYKTLPFVDQQDMYAHVYDCLTKGGAIGIFPEGGSHDRTDLLPLKAGVSTMALGAMANDPNLHVKIIPVGLSYFHAHRFRSRAVIEFGAPLDVPVELVELFKQGSTQKREAVSKFLELVYDALKTVTIRASSYEELMVIQAVRRLYSTPGQHLTLGQVVELNKRLLQAYVHFKDEPRIEKLRKDVLTYNRQLKNLGLKDHQVPRAQKATWKTLGLLTYRLILLMMWTVFALPGTVLNAPIFITAAFFSRKKQNEALAASVVKIAARDVLATWKILICLGLAPVLYGFYALIAVALAIKANAPLSWCIFVPIAVAIALPLMNFAALKFGEAGVDVLKSLPPLIIALVPGQQKSLDKVKAMRVQLSNEVADVIQTFGPKLYGDDFNQWRILVPAASVPPSTTERPSLFHRKSGNGGMDAPGLALTHPFTWIDERLFGWSTTTKYGTSAWGGGSITNSREGSQMGTPTAETEEEDDGGDYEDIAKLSIPFSEESSGLGYKSRSRGSSYADLQRLRMTANTSKKD